MAEPRNILYLNSWSTAHGGSSTSLIDVVTHLDPARYRPVVMCPTDGDLPRRLRDVGARVVLRGMHRPTREELTKFVAEVPRHWRWLRAEEIALVHGNTSSSRRSIVQAAVLGGIPYVQHVRSMVRGSTATYGFRKASRIVCNSDEVASALRRDAALGSKTVTIYNAVDLSRYDSDEDTRREEIGVAPSRPIVGFVGRIVPSKGVTTLIGAMPDIRARVPDALLVLVGCPPPDETEYDAECRAMVERLGLTEHVRFVGYRRDVPAWMRTFNVFALPTRAEAFGKVVIEAMAAGCPVVASRVGGIPEIVTEPGLGTLVAPDDPKAVAAAVLPYLTDPRQARDVGSRGAASVRERFGMGRMLGRLQALYDEVLDGVPR